MTTWLRGASLYGSGGNAGDGSAAPGRKSPRWSAERRASRVMGRAAPHSRGSVASRKRDNRDSAPVGAPPTPPFGDGRDHKDTTRAQQRAPGTKKTALFDIVRTENPPHPEEARSAVSKGGRPRSTCLDSCSRRALRALLNMRTRERRRLHRSFGRWAKRTHGGYPVRPRRPALA